MLVPKRIAAAIATACLAVTGLATTATAAPTATTDLRLIAFNDFHGNLQPPAGSSGRVTLPNGTTVDAGGAAYLAAHVARLRGEAPNSLVLSAGDAVGASPLTSALFHDEPTVEFLNKIGTDAAVIGNHEFDEGYRELLRLQFGGCHPTDGCQFRPTFRGSRFPYLGANITFDNGLPAALPVSVKFVEGIPVGVIGVTLKDLPSVVTPEAIKGFQFGDEVAAINRTSRLLDLAGIRAQVVLLHQGDSTEGGGPDDCRTLPGPARQIATAASASVDAFFTGHSHQQYNCVVNDPAGNPRPLIQGASFGRLLSVVDLKLDRKSRDVLRARTTAHNEIVTRTITPDAGVQALVDEAVAKSGPIANRQVGTISADLVRAAPVSGESPIGDVIADGQLAATQGNQAQIAVTNPGGIRTDLTYAGSPAGEGNGVVTYGEAFAVQPFSNILQTITLTGAQLKTVLEQQWQPQANGTTITRFLQVSDSLHYSWSQSGTQGNRVSAVTVAGQPLDPAASYRVTVNNFLAAGGDGFTELAKGTNLNGGPVDLDAFTAYLTAHPNLAPPAPTRVTVIP
ncbi:bifunctional metallophosphatase/5'-nucleotidase [Actinokineospora sp. NBRC 105648]|uniref:bifunctional metallophosphatase/5'-nucleotidase n=1 Tax=Actinokineospora sp. NBRC 105648 TaxID=3032206 RepID=UPI0024A2041B|nr:bifunctional metallophosphatase/5'-nucleotidase [Actinokineospora sp. NBRC 105648]GLZ40675.1 bifunctional metallophosphatase/5'-nucleotidase [Actinokineospora sp. NBRC 105648]